MRSLILLCGALSCLSLSGCAIAYKAPVKPPLGILYSNYTVPVTTDFDGTPATSPKVGKASSGYILIPLFGDFAFDDAGIKKAAANGGINKIHYAEHEFYSVLGIFGTFCTIVYGE